MASRDVAAQIAAQLSMLRSADGVLDEAAELATIAAAHAQPRASAPKPSCSPPRPTVDPSPGGEAERLGRDAVDRVPADMLNLRADLLMCLSQVLMASGSPARAAAELDYAVHLYPRKGNVVAAARARHLAGAPGPPGTANDP